MQKSVLEIRKKISEMKKQYGNVITNFYPGILSDVEKADLCEEEKALIFIVQEPHRRRLFFAATDIDLLETLLKDVPQGVVLEYIYREEENPLKESFLRGKFEEYAIYVRITTKYSGSPYTIPESGRRKLLEEMYNSNCGEYAKLSDVEALYKITMETFDVVCDDVFSLEKWKEIINNQECILYKESGEIIAYYVWNLQGKKLYSNMTVNRGTADILYSMERRVFEQMWENGIRIYYAWFDVKNKKALLRGNKRIKEVIESQEMIYNGVYVKK